LLGRRVNKHKLINFSFLMAKASAIGDLVEIEALSASHFEAQSSFGTGMAEARPSGATR
jgi:hypothetical protein